MSSEYSLLSSLLLAQTNLYSFGGTILIGFGTVSCILSLIVFMRKELRKNPCSVYLAAFNISNFLLIYTSILFSTLSLGYKIDVSAYSMGLCHFRFYTIFLFDILSPFYLILASIDRILITSRNALTRQRSTVRLAYICIITVTLFWVFFHIHALFLSTWVQTGPGLFICYFQAGIYTSLTTYYAVIKVVLVILSMFISGLWAIRNVRSLGRVALAPAILATETTTTTVRRVRINSSKDHQLFQMLLVDIGFYIFFNIFILVVLMYQQFTQDPSASLLKVRINTIFVTIGTFSTYIPFCIGCYINLFVSKTFRHEVKNILMCK